MSYSIAKRGGGPKTSQGVEACKNNALRHGLLALQTVTPGEDPGEWESHRAAVVADLHPEGAVELALAEQVAVKLWRLGRVVRFEGDVIADGQNADELTSAHEFARGRDFGEMSPTDIPSQKDVTAAKKKRQEAEEKLADWKEAIHQLEALATMKNDDAFEDWSLYNALHDEFRLPAHDFDEEPDDDEDEKPFRARDAWAILKTNGRKKAGEIRERLVVTWTEKRKELETRVRRLRTKHKKLEQRYQAALERGRRSHGLPSPADLDRIQRYEAHLEWGLHKALDRLRDLQETRGAVPPKGPSSVTLAMIQTGQTAAPGANLSPFGSFALEATGGVRGEDGSGSGGIPKR